MINKKDKTITLSYPSVNPIINLFRRIGGKPIPKFQLHATISMDMIQDMKVLHGVDLLKELKKTLKFEYKKDIEQKSCPGYCGACTDDNCEIRRK